MKKTIGDMIRELKTDIEMQQKAIMEIDKFKLILANTPEKDKRGTVEQFMRKHGLNPDLIIKK